MLGADHRGQRLNALYRENIDEQAILDALDPLFQLYSEHGHIDEGFGDFLMRTDTVRVSTPIDLELLDARA